MPTNTPNDIKTLAYVIRRTNYGEADRIINLITPEGKISAIAKGVRKEKSKLAGGIEMFSLININIHRGKSELGVVTSTKMLKYYDKLLTDFNKMELAALILKRVSMLAESSDSPDYFKIVDQGLSCLNAGLNEKLVESWFWLNLMKVSGEEINLYRDTDGQKLVPEKRYDWDTMAMSFTKNEQGRFGADEIKMLRLILTTDLGVVGRVKNIDGMLVNILDLARRIGRV